MGEVDADERGHSRCGGADGEGMSLGWFESTLSRTASLARANAL
jgi:hypothetical protein